MKLNKRLLALSLALVMALSALAGCSKDPAGSSDKSGSGSDSLPDGSAQQAEPMDLAAVTDPFLATAGVAGDTVVAKVGGHDITAAQLLYWVNYSVNNYLAQFGGLMSDIPWDTDLGDGATIADSFKEGALNSAAFYRLLPVIAGEEGLTPDPAVETELQQQLDDLTARLGSEEPVIHSLWYQMTTWEQFLTLNQSADLHLQLQELYFGEGSEDYPTDAEVLSYLDETGIYRAKHILVMAVDAETREPLEQSVIDEKKAQAEELLAQIRAADDPIAKFDELMTEFSEDPGLATNPDGYVAQKGQMVPEFETAALALENGEISDVVYSESTGFHIILRLPLDPADYRSQLVGQRMGDLADQWLAEYGIETTQAYDELDLAHFWTELERLKAAIETEVQQAEEQAAGDQSEG